MWPYIHLNPVGIIILCLLFFSLYLIYSANSSTNDLMKSYEMQNFLQVHRKKINLDDDEMPTLNNIRQGYINDEIIKQEFRLFEMVNLIELLNVAIQAAENGGRQVRKVRELSNMKQKDKGINDPLTEGNQMIEKFIFLFDLFSSHSLSLSNR